MDYKIDAIEVVRDHTGYIIYLWSTVYKVLTQWSS